MVSNLAFKTRTFLKKISTHNIIIHIITSKTDPISKVNAKCIEQEWAGAGLAVMIRLQLWTEAATTATSPTIPIKLPRTTDINNGYIESD